MNSSSGCLPTSLRRGLVVAARVGEASFGAVESDSPAVAVSVVAEGRESVTGTSTLQRGQRMRTRSGSLATFVLAPQAGQRTITVRDFMGVGGEVRSALPVGFELLVLVAVLAEHRGEQPQGATLLLKGGRHVAFLEGFGH